MDNASKALIMAGATLLALLIISLTMYMLNSFRDYNENVSRSNKSSQDEAFNRYFVSSHYNMEGTIFGYEAYNLINKAIDIYDDDDEASKISITTNSGGTPLIGVNTPAAMYSTYSAVFDGDNMLKKFKYSYTFGDNGRIATISIVGPVS